MFLILELWAPYRPNSVSKTKRWANNLALVAVNTLVMRLIFGGAVLAVALHVTQRELGLLNMLALPYALKVFLGVAFLDFMLYVWHLLNHEMPLLWRFHRVHHTDLNMDVSTATRFHLGELVISAVIRMGLIYVMGIDFLTLIIFESALLFCAQFHHSLIKVPVWLEGILIWLTITPSMHRIHHSVKIKERNRNYGTIFAWWDRLMGTMLLAVDQAGIKIGVGGHFQESKLNLHHLLVMPFTRQVP